MNTGSTIFSVISDFVPVYEGRNCIPWCRGNYNVKTVSWLDQLCCLILAQLTYRDSVCDIEACPGSMKNKWYHRGIRSTVSGNTITYADEKRDWCNYVDFARIHIFIHVVWGLYLYYLSMRTFALNLILPCMHLIPQWMI